MRLEILSDPDAVARAGADCLLAHLRQKPALNLLVATGNTPMPMYQELGRRKLNGEADFSQLRAFQLDEYLGVADEDPISLSAWMRRSFLDPLEISSENTVRLRGDGADHNETCRAYDRLVCEAGGIDFAVLGLGPNGHLGFNEPPTLADSPTRVVRLSESSLASNAAYWKEKGIVPSKALTAGMSIIMEADFVLLLVCGRTKNEILRKTLYEDIKADVPASLLRLRAKPTLILADSEAAK